MSNNDLEKAGVLRIIGSFLKTVGGRMRFADSAFSFEFPVADFSLEESSVSVHTRTQDLNTYIHRHIYIRICMCDF